ncbi:hypothetical protein Cch01nite_00220 [Cellulomonas chitinilytica]|uniref:Methylamine utilisation protein MauE domain-containing protein n=1 Tax=Cellulomonas chitinilytica TaxID=398759 RepID=A0A919TY38_9CELL|nr:MauE/DoxX family redox-associated membrane protein [Cellulomonas chitinilytica]GIG19298.1 hypothetical protein Cch01nite_00220 [Cellulomonas chitinilytica]
MAWLGVAYISFTFAATGWAKLLTVRGTARSLQVTWQTVPRRAVMAAVVVVGTAEVGLATGAALWPAQHLVAFGCAGLLLSFAVYNTAVARRGADARTPCLCAGPTAQALESSGFARATANVLVALSAVLWGSVIDAPIPWAQALLLGLVVLPVVVWAWRRVRTTVAAVTVPTDVDRDGAGLLAAYSSDLA